MQAASNARLQVRRRIRYPFVQDLGQEEAQRVVRSKEGAGLKALPSGLSPFTSQSGRFVSRFGVARTSLPLDVVAALGALLAAKHGDAMNPAWLGLHA